MVGYQSQSHSRKCSSQLPASPLGRIAKQQNRQASFCRGPAEYVSSISILISAEVHKMIRPFEYSEITRDANGVAHYNRGQIHC